MGRKKSLETKELEQRIERYFEKCDEQNFGEKDAKKIRKPYSLSGLLCDIELSRSEFESMNRSRRYGHVLNKALARIEAFTEENALTGSISASAAANSLKYNFGWGASKNSEDVSNGARSIKIILDEDMMRLAE